MSQPKRSVTVAALGRSVVCTSCGAVWAADLPTTAAALTLAARMNGDPLTVVPGEYRVQRGLCHGTGTGRQWAADVPTKGTPPDWADRIVVARPAPEPEGDDRPPWPVAIGLAVAGIARVGVTLPRALARGLLVPVLGVVAAAALLSRTGDVGSAALTLVLNGLIVLLVVTSAVGATLTCLWLARSHPEETTLDRVARAFRVRSKHDA